MVDGQLEDAVRSKVHIRKMTTDDIPHVCLIEQESFTLPWSADAFHNEVKNNQFAVYLIMELASEVIGYAGMWLIMDEAHITNIALKSKYRGQQLGSLLLRTLQEHAIAQGITKMTLEVRPSNRIAQNLYDKFGFRFSGLRKGYYSDNGEDAMIMWADLKR